MRINPKFENKTQTAWQARKLETLTQAGCSSRRMRITTAIRSAKKNDWFINFFKK